LGKKLIFYVGVDVWQSSHQMAQWQLMIADCCVRMQKEETRQGRSPEFLFSCCIGQVSTASNNTNNTCCHVSKFSQHAHIKMALGTFFLALGRRLQNIPSRP
jgi:hypothetical protein